jgi:hypothetical protein
MGLLISFRLSSLHDGQQDLYQREVSLLLNRQIQELMNREKPFELLKH